MLPGFVGSIGVFGVCMVAGCLWRLCLVGCVGVFVARPVGGVCVGLRSETVGVHGAVAVVHGVFHVGVFAVGHYFVGGGEFECFFEVVGCSCVVV